jgi:hypothetical protein
MHAAAWVPGRERRKSRDACYPEAEATMMPALLFAAAVGSGLGLEPIALQGADGRGPTNADLRLVATAKTRLMVGEFLTVSTTVMAKHRVRLCDRDVAIDVDDGHGFVEHAEAFGGIECVFGDLGLAPGHSFVAEQVVGLEALDPPATLSATDSLNASARFVFDRPGIYRVRSRHGDAVSNVIVVEAVVPKGEDARLLAALRQQPAVLSGIGVADDSLRAAGQQLLAEFGPRPLLQPFLRRLPQAAGGGPR